MARSLASRFSWALVTVSLFLAAAALRAQENEWAKLMKDGDKAVRSFKFAKAEKDFQTALIQTQAFPSNDLRIAETVGKLADLYAKEEKFAEAEELRKRAVSITEAAVGPDDPRFACAQIGLALTYEFERKPEDAAPIWGRYFPVLQKLARPLDPTVSSAMILVRSEVHNLEIRYRQDPEFAETAILEIDEKVYGPDSPQAGSDAQSLGRLYERDGRYGAAYPLLLRSMAISRKADEKEKSVSAVHRDAATAWDVTVLLLEVPLFHEAAPGPFLNPHWAWVPPYERFRQYEELARVAAASGKFPEAEQLYKQIISMDENDAASNKKYNITGQAGDWVDLSRVYRHEHRYNDALDAMEKYKAVDELAAKVKFANQWDETRLHWYSQNELGEIYREKGDLAAARPLFERSMEMIKTISLGKRHPRIAELQSNYAAFLADEGRLGEAESAYKLALDTWANRYGESPELLELEHAEALSNYAALLRKLGRLADAEPLEAQASVIREKTTGASTVNVGEFR